MTLYALNATHDPQRRSWVDSANAAGHAFPIQNLPWGVCRRLGQPEAFRPGVAIGDQVLDLPAALYAGLGHGWPVAWRDALTQPQLNAFMALGAAAWHQVRADLSAALSLDSPLAEALAPCLIPQSAIEHALPARIGDYTDFYTSIHHATHIGRLFRPDNPLLPNYQWVPIGYHGRASSVVLSGEPIWRPQGQTLAAGASQPVLGPSQRLDIELELGALIGPGNPRGQSIGIDQAQEQVFGLCLLNDWSARDIQAWEYQPLGPFLSKNFATSLSPWVVTLEALAPFRVAPPTRPAGDPPPLPYLDSSKERQHGAIDIRLGVELSTISSRADGLPAFPLARTSYRHAYWTLGQMVTHHTVNGCPLQAGDLLGTGTLSGPEAGEAGALIEMTEGGKQPLQLPNGETRRFLLDGDEVTLSGWCERPGAVSIGFGHCVGRIHPAA